MYPRHTDGVRPETTQGPQRYPGRFVSSTYYNCERERRTEVSKKRGNVQTSLSDDAVHMTGAKQASFGGMTVTFLKFIRLTLRTKKMIDQ